MMILPPRSQKAVMENYLTEIVLKLKFLMKMLKHILTFSFVSGAQ